MIDWLPHVNATLNSIATALLVIGWITIKSRHEKLHRNAMLAAFTVSAIFLVSYLTYHYQAGSKAFPRELYPTAAYFYYPLLASHVILAMGVPVLAIWAIVLGLKDRRAGHRRVVKFAFPIWLYVSVTGVLVYLMLYWWFPPGNASPSGDTVAIVAATAMSTNGISMTGAA